MFSPVRHTVTSVETIVLSRFSIAPLHRQPAKVTVSPNLPCRSARHSLQSVLRRDGPCSSHVSGSVDLNLEELIDRKVFRFMGDAAAAYLAMEQTIKDSGLTPEQISQPPAPA